MKQILDNEVKLEERRTTKDQTVFVLVIEHFHYSVPLVHLFPIFHLSVSNHSICSCKHLNFMFLFLARFYEKIKNTYLLLFVLFVQNTARTTSVLHFKSTLEGSANLKKSPFKA